MTPDNLRKNFNEQLETVEDQIRTLESQLDKAKEYKLKLLGGLETLNILEDNNSDNDLNNIQKSE